MIWPFTKIEMLKRELRDARAYASAMGKEVDTLYELMVKMRIERDKANDALKLARKNDARDPKTGRYMKREQQA